MKALTTPAGNFGPFKTIEVLDDRYQCDDLQLQFIVVGVGEIVEADTLTWPAPPGPTPEEIQGAIIAATQSRLDTFARTRNYDGILSASTYATSTVPKFSAEGQYAVDARDSTWSALYTLMGEVLAGTRPMPESFADVEPLLPTLVWPA